MKLILVRHGRTIANVMEALDTDFPGNPLDATGLAQAQALPGRLAEAGLLDEIGGLWVSPILRARQTIAPIERALGLQAQITSGIREVLAGDLEMNTDRESVLCYTDTTRAWMVGRTHARLPGSHENGVDTFTRFDDAVAGIYEAMQATAPGKAALLTSHGTVLRLWTALAGAADAGLDPAWIAEHPMRNTAISVLEGQPGAWRLVSWNNGEWVAAGAAA